MKPQRFNIRVYGLLKNSDNELLVADEVIRGKQVTKLPGGGLEFGEGTLDCLKREFREELNLDIEVSSHFYTTDFFQPSAFNAADQVVSIYYIVHPAVGENNTIKKEEIDFSKLDDPMLKFRWIPLKEISAESFTLPIDKIVGRMLQENFSSGAAAR